MKEKSRLQNSSNIEDEVENVVDLPRHKILTYEGFCDKEDGFCKLRPSKCLHGLFDQGNLAKNIRMFDHFYSQQISCDTDFDERYFINHKGLQHTPIKLVSPMTNFSITPVAL